MVAATVIYLGAVRELFQFMQIHVTSCINIIYHLLIYIQRYTYIYIYRDIHIYIYVLFLYIYTLTYTDI
jgi:hypothetical protein